MATTMSQGQTRRGLRELNAPNVLKSCNPGCEELTVIGNNEFEAVAVNKIGPVKAKFKGKVQLTDIDPPNSYRIPGQGDGGIAGFAKGGAVVKLADAENGSTLLKYDVAQTCGIFLLDNKQI